VGRVRRRFSVFILRCSRRFPKRPPAARGIAWPTSARLALWTCAHRQ
jgi:hypothetical protein